MKPWVYIASPYTQGDKFQNTYLAMKEWDAVFSSGLVVPYCPLLSHFQDERFPRPYEDWMTFSLALLDRFDALYRLPGYSPGADREEARMRELGKPVFYCRNTLYVWAEKS
jgi:hypothetical protein